MSRESQSPMMLPAFPDGPCDNDELVKVTTNDTTPGFLAAKLVAGHDITITTHNPGGNEHLNIAAANNRVKVSANDTQHEFLGQKLVAGTNVTLTTNNPGANETLTIAAAGGVTGFTASVNTAAPNATVNVARLLVDVPTTNGDAAFVPKGTGSVLAALPDNAVSGGNKRGIHAVDLSTVRAANTDVASGNYSVNLSARSMASGVYSVTIGYNSIATGTGGAVLGGDGARSNGNCTVALGTTQNFSGNGSYNCFLPSNSGSIGNGANYAVVQGASVTVDPDCTGAQSWGFGARSYSLYQRTFGSPINFGSGAIQQEEYILAALTTNNTLTEMLILATANAINRIIIQNTSSYTFDALITARRTNVSTDTAGWRVTGMIENSAGTTAFVGTPLVTLLGASAGAATWALSVTANDTTDNLRFNVTGETGKTIRWGAYVNLMKIGGF
jgi:hypothetical protein